MSQHATIYTIGVRIPMGEVVEAVKDFEKAINKSMADFGFCEKISLTYVQGIQLSAQRPLTNPELAQFKKLVEDTFKERFGRAKVEYFLPCTPIPKK